VFQTNAPYRYAYMPPMDEVLRDAPHLFVEPGASPNPAAGATPLGTITRDYAGQALASYQVYLVK
jgi:hypothetical protein